MKKTGRSWSRKTSAQQEAYREEQRARSLDWWADPGNREKARLASQAGWRAQNPERAVIRDELLATLEQQPCEVCGAGESVLFVTDYEKRSVKWRCRPCARAEQADYRAHAMAPDPLPAGHDEPTP